MAPSTQRARPRPSIPALRGPRSVTFPASSSQVRSSGLTLGRNGDGSPTSCRPSVTPPRTPSRPGRLVAATACPGRHETPGTSTRTDATAPTRRPRPESNRLAPFRQYRDQVETCSTEPNLRLGAFDSTHLYGKVAGV